MENAEIVYNSNKCIVTVKTNGEVLSLNENQINKMMDLLEHSYTKTKPKGGFRDEININAPVYIDISYENDQTNYDDTYSPSTVIIVFFIILIFVVLSDRAKYRRYYSFMGIPRPRYHFWYMFMGPHRHWYPPGKTGHFRRFEGFDTDDDDDNDNFSGGPGGFGGFGGGGFGGFGGGGHIGGGFGGGGRSGGGFGGRR